VRWRELRERDAADMQRNRKLRKLLVAHDRAKHSPFRAAVGNEAIEKLKTVTVLAERS